MHSRGCALLNNVLYSLSCFLEQHGKIRSLELDLRLESMIDSPTEYAGCTCVETAFQPLRGLSILTGKVEILDSQRVPQVIQQKITALWDQPTWSGYDTTPLQTWTSTIKRAEACDSLDHSLQNLELIDLPEQKTSTQESNGAVTAIAVSLNEIRNKFRYGHKDFITPGTERSVIEPYRDLETALDRLDLDEVRREVMEQVMEKARRDLGGLGDVISRLS